MQRAGSGPRLRAPRRAARWRSGAVGAWQRLRAPALSALARGLGAVPTWSLRGACHADFRAQADFSPLPKVKWRRCSGSAQTPLNLLKMKLPVQSCFHPQCWREEKKKPVSYFLIFETVLQICLQYVTLF